MASSELFPRRPALMPSVYAYEETNPQLKGLLKVGYTTGDARERLKQIYPVVTPGKPTYRIVLEESAMRSDGTTFTDHDVHRHLRYVGVSNPRGEWFRCTADKVKAAVIAVRENREYEGERTSDFRMRPEQEAAVERTACYFSEMLKKRPGKAPHFLWNAKMRFGKTFASYQLAKRMGWKKLLVLTFKPAVQHAWKEDLGRHVDFEGWQFIAPGGLSYEKASRKRPIVCFGSFQDYLQPNRSTGGIKPKNEWVHATNWDCVILDEYHFGAWRERAKGLFESDDDEEARIGEGAGQFEATVPISTRAYLYLSGTPFRALTSGEFIEEQVFSWTYSDEQRAKRDWRGFGNPYECLPRMVLMTYQLPDAIREIASQGEFNEFDLGEFFGAEGVGVAARFRHEDEVQKWLDLLRGAHLLANVESLKLGSKKPPLPFADVRLLGTLTHSLWFLPSVAACHAMRNLLGKRQNAYYRDYVPIVAAGSEAGMGPAALPPVLDSMADPLKTKTITLTCGKLTHGVTVRPWSSIFMLRNCSSPETYFQAAFRVQSPWTVRNPDGESPNSEEVLKEECYVFDFAPDRALRQIADYASRLSTDDTSPEQKVEEFISFLPVLAYDGSSMKRLDAAGILDIAMSGTTATLLARRWESALLVNVDNDTLKRLMASEEAMKALMSIEGFRSLNQDIETIINKSEAVDRLRREKYDKKLTARERAELTEEEKEYKSRRREIQEKLIKFATRIPVFMYLTDFREQCLKDVISKLEPDLFKRVTGLTKQDFALLVSLNVFNSSRMNAAVFSFRRYEDPSLRYLEIDKHKGEDVGLYDTTLKAAEYEAVMEGESG